MFSGEGSLAFENSVIHRTQNRPLMGPGPLAWTQVLTAKRPVAQDLCIPLSPPSCPKVYRLIRDRCEGLFDGSTICFSVHFPELFQPFCNTQGCWGDFNRRPYALQCGQRGEEVIL